MTRARTSTVDSRALLALTLAAVCVAIAAPGGARADSNSSQSVTESRFLEVNRESSSNAVEAPAAQSSKLPVFVPATRPEPRLRLVAGNRLELVDAASGKVVARRLLGRADRVKISPAGDLVAVVSNERLHLIAADGLQRRLSLVLEDTVEALEFDPAGRTLTLRHGSGRRVALSLAALLSTTD